MRDIKFSIQRRQRSSYFSWEHYDHGPDGFYNLTVGSPTAHRWWAFSLTMYYKNKE